MMARFLLAALVVSIFAGLTAPKEVLEDYDFFKDYDLFETMEVIEEVVLKDMSGQMTVSVEDSSACVKSFEQLESSFTAVYSSTQIVKSSSPAGGFYENRK